MELLCGSHTFPIGSMKRKRGPKEIGSRNYRKLYLLYLGSDRNNFWIKSIKTQFQNKFKMMLSPFLKP